jgi:hypothetical protein
MVIEILVIEIMVIEIMVVEKRIFKNILSDLNSTELK